MRALLEEVQELTTYVLLPTFQLRHSQLGLASHVLWHVPAVGSSINCLDMSNRTHPSKTVGPMSTWDVLWLAHLLPNQLGQ